MRVRKRVVVIIPCYNEEESIEELINQMQDVQSALNKKFNLEVMLINDGSQDNTARIIKDLSKRHEYIYFRTFAYNAGHQSAIRAGIDVSADYDAAIMMDADLQHPPSYIPQMLNEWENKNVKIVQMVRDDNYKDVGIIKFWTSRSYYVLMNYMSGLSIAYGSSDFRLVDGSIIKTIANSPERDLFLRGYFSWLKVSKSNIKYKPNKRFAGESKYTLRKMLDLGKKGILQFSEKPLRLATNLGIVMAIASLIYGVYVIVNFLMGDKAVSGWTSLMVVMLFCFGVNFILVGFIGRYLAHSIYLQKRRPDYIIDEQKLPENINHKA